MFNRAIHKAYRKINKIPDVEPKNGGGSTFACHTYRGTLAHPTPGTGPSAVDHFKDEVKNQFRDLTWQKRPPKQ
ncbi:hypothetical protein P153DRAFT_366252 [Dothidotthia symphoricarpi CBS 119687]|uniref:Uncharacterized protein n=1 Tax=Dothidotthia symphoricarpi CBS 119687 TaxID=1392245 RepID=A0A6A6AFM2_9PLEO|nr:uncharacterized protein P153DRAFT_366252 [Dothidotthia symphoricarpi CBS 119687]KAF2129744.1 hypothetical protein P153DRAFT_366252 [Dothidotthia symphoricarpi CBS 119687]